MGWSGRAPAPPAIEAGKGAKDKEHAMPEKLNATVAVGGIDAKSLPRVTPRRLSSKQLKQQKNS
jgi:hypothetical protein